MATNGKKSRKKIIIFSILGVLVIALGLIIFLGASGSLSSRCRSKKPRSGPSPRW